MPSIDKAIELRLAYHLLLALFQYYMGRCIESLQSFLYSLLSGLPSLRLLVSGRTIFF
jgi:hypothetical protein